MKFPPNLSVATIMGWMAASASSAAASSNAAFFPSIPHPATSSKSTLLRAHYIDPIHNIEKPRNVENYIGSPKESHVGSETRNTRKSYAPFAPENGAVGRFGAVGIGGIANGSTDGGYSAYSVPAGRPALSAAAAAGASSVSPSGSKVGVPIKRYGLGSGRGTTLPASKSMSSVDTYFSSFQNEGAVVMSDTSMEIVEEAEPMVPLTPRLRRPVVAGNWKLNPATKSEAITLLKLLAANFLNHRDPSDVTAATPEMVIFPPLLYLADALDILSGTGICVGAQNCSPFEKGAFTGEIAPSMLASSGVTHVLLGHSERRTLFGETDENINNSLLKCMAQPGLKVVLCVGETLQEYESGQLEQVVNIQIRMGLQGVTANQLLEDRIIIAYEPVWAIGTGLVASPSQAQHAHSIIRSILASMYNEVVTDAVRIQYGGSVSPDSIEELMGEPDVDGALVGGASLNADSFTRIFDGAEAADGRKKSALNSALGVRGGAFAGAGEMYYPPREFIATEVVATKNALGESPVWSDRDQSLYWVSATEGEVWRWNLNDPPYRKIMNTPVGCIGLLNDPTNPSQPGSILVAAERAILTTSMVSSHGDPSNPIYDFATGPSILCDRPDHMTTTRPNDGRVDRFGNMVLGMYNMYHRSGASEGENNAGLYRLNCETLEFEEILDYKFRVSNCISFSPDGKTMYFGDTPTRCVYAFDYSHTGPLRNRRKIWTMPANLPGGPDGAQVDANGKLWIALTGAGRVIQLNPDSGLLETVVHLEANPTSLTFGGKDLDEMFITTRSPNGGGLYRLKMPYGIRGVSEPEFRFSPFSRQPTQAKTFGLGGGKKVASILSSVDAYFSSLQGSK